MASTAGYKFTDEQVIAALKDSGGILRDIVQRLETIANHDIAEGQEYKTITRGALWDRLQREPLKTLYDAEREEVDDLGESALRNAIKNGEPWAIQLWAKYRGKHRGYVEVRHQENREVTEFSDYSDEELNEIINEVEEA